MGACRRWDGDAEGALIRQHQAIFIYGLQSAYFISLKLPVACGHARCNVTCHVPHAGMGQGEEQEQAPVSPSTSQSILDSPSCSNQRLQL